MNEMFLLGEVVDRGSYLIDERKHFVVRARLKLKVEKGTSVREFAYVDVYSKPKDSNEISLICEVGNIVYAVCQFALARVSKQAGVPYVEFKSARVMYRPNKKYVMPNTKVITLLDEEDPIGYIKNHK